MNPQISFIIKIFWFLTKIAYFILLAGYGLNSINCMLNSDPNANQVFLGLLVLGTIISLYWRINKHITLLKQGIKSNIRPQINLNMNLIQSIRGYCDAIKQMPRFMLVFLSAIFLSGLFKIAMTYMYQLNEECGISKFEFYICDNEWLWKVVYVCLISVTLWISKATFLYEQNYKSLSYAQKLLFIAMSSLILGAFFRFLVYSFLN